MPIQVSEREVMLFDLSIHLACCYQSREHLTGIEHFLEHKEAVQAEIRNRETSRGPLYGRRADGCLVVSFDSTWYPFLDDTMGYNRPEKRCWYVPKNPVLDHVTEALRSLRLPQNGGRTFLHENGAMRAGNIELVRWTLAVRSEYLRRLGERVHVQ